mmetsp:Transcript_18900/g.42243  ORF Transcript_18900/g.42243 Transcript_18900/m.42243 type:complete len:134 (-) Transcript_18900:438-839(-)
MHLRAPSMSSHEREIGNVDSSSDSMGETPLLPPVSPPALAPAMAIGALWEGIAGALAGGGKAVPLSYRFSTWFSPCASVSLPDAGAPRESTQVYARGSPRTQGASHGARLRAVWREYSPLLQLGHLLGRQRTS